MEELYTKVLDFSRNRITEKDLNRIVDLLTNTKTVGELDVSNNAKAIHTYATKFASALKVNKSLTHLNLSHNPIKEEIATALFEHETITHLNLLLASVPHGSFEKIIMTKNLKYLNVSRIIIFIASKMIYFRPHEMLIPPLIKLLLTTSTLKYLNVSKNIIRSEDAKPLFIALLFNKSLTDLNLADNDIDGSCILELTEMIKRNKSLKILNLSKNKFNGTDLKKIALSLLQNQMLSDIDLSSNLIEPCADTMKSIALLLGNKTLTSLNLSCNHLGDDILRAVAEQLRKNTTLTKLYLDEEIMSLHVVKELVFAFQHNNTLSTFNLGMTRNYKFCYVTATLIATSLMMKNQITHLDFSFYNFGIQGVKLVAEFLKHSQTITDLKLHWNYYDKKGTNPIAEALVSNKSLLNLVFCQPGSLSEQIVPLWNALKKNVTLLSLCVSLSPTPSFPEIGINELIEVLKCNNVLNSIDIGIFQISSGTLQKLTQAVALNTTIVNFLLHDDKTESVQGSIFYGNPRKYCPEEIRFYLERNRNLLRKCTGIARYIYSHRGETELILSRVSKKDLEEFEEYKGRSALIKSLSEFGFSASQAVKVIDSVHSFINRNFFNITGISEGLFSSLNCDVHIKIASYLMLKDVL